MNETFDNNDNKSFLDKLNETNKSYSVLDFDKMDKKQKKANLINKYKRGIKNEFEQNE